MLGSSLPSSYHIPTPPPFFPSPPQMQPHLLRLNALYGSNVCGEGGEYETLVLDCPGLFKNGRIVLDDTEVGGGGWLGAVVQEAVNILPEAIQAGGGPVFCSLHSDMVHPLIFFPLRLPQYPLQLRSRLPSLYLTLTPSTLSHTSDRHSVL